MTHALKPVSSGSLSEPAGGLLVAFERKGGLAHLEHLEGIPFLIPLEEVDALLALIRPEQRVG
ncbi:Hypothetical protein (plasmid) [Pseudomonas putida]|jgi:hypothetical protein|nr:Hypothetical protein [Pseudomonas putida]